MSYKFKKINFHKVCRSCLCERGHLREIFSTKLPIMMENCASIQVSIDDGLPPYVCVTCFHLIAKFYTFKKKMERSERILKSCIKPNVLKEKDILDIAVSEAQIEEVKYDEENVFEELDYSDEDMPLSEKQKHLQKQKAEMEMIAKVIVEEEKEGIVIGEKKFFLDGPPPLIPLEPAKKVDEPSATKQPSLPEDPPPLVPIKPIVITDKILSNVIENPIEINLQCSTCNEEFNSVQSLKEHKLTSCRESELKCRICRKEFRERKRLIGHLKGHMVQKDYGCKICGKRYPNPSTFRVHMRTHTGERPFKCQICNKGFVRWAGVVGHMKTHQSHKPYKCDTCGKGFKISSNLERHKVLHKDSLPYCCSYCGKTFSQSDNLQLHVRTYHTNERPYLCNECGKGFVSSTRLNRHMWVHTGYKPYRCKTCTKAYSNSNDLKNHERTHLGSAGEIEKPYPCRVCDLRFFHPCRLAKHMKTHDRPFSCNYCLKRFSSSVLLNKHLNGKKCPRYVVVDEEAPASQIYLEY